MSKGSNQRPAQIPKKKYDENWDRIFGKKKKKKKTDISGNRIFGNINCNLY